MSVYHDFTRWPRGPLHLAVGVFDGVHVGHQAVVGTVVAGARATGGTPIATTFDPLPIEVLAPGAPPSLLSDIDERRELLLRAGAQGVVVFHFTKDFAAMSPEEFVRRLLSAGEVRQICVGEDFRFGHDRAGNVRVLGSLAEHLGFTLTVATPTMLDGGVVSSTRVRNAVVAGDVEQAARLLGRSYAVTGAVDPGDQRGRALGFPTVSLHTPPNRLLPRDGIYAVWCTVAGERVPAAASIGVRSTADIGERRLELYLLDWTGDAPSGRVRAEFVKRLRDELRFANPAELAEQIAKDVEATRAALG